jgi:putative glutamine amidotransferase
MTRPAQAGPVPILVTTGGQMDKVVDGAVRAVHVRTSYTGAVWAAGGLPLVYGSPAEAAAVDALLDQVGGVVLTGGGDIAPERFGQAPHPTVFGVDPERDELELRLARAALERDVPVLGICRGMQVLTVAEGEALIQDIASALPGALRHEGRGARRQDDAHTVRLEAGVPAGDLLRAAGGGEIPVNSFHHQAAAAVPRAWRAFAWAPDGILEGMQREDRAFAVAVQWHPEDRWSGCAPERELFAAFVAAARHSLAERARVA